MAAARKGAGDDMDIMVDLHGRASAAMAIQYARVLEPYRPFFLEEPCQPEDPDGIARVARATPIPIAAGERLTHRREFLPLLQSQAIAVAQPDVCHAGGLTEVRRIAGLCDTFGISMAPHNPLGPVATMVNIHLGFALPNFLIQEVMRADEAVSGVAPIVGGYVEPSLAPGIGVDIDLAAAAKHPYAEAPPVRVDERFEHLERDRRPAARRRDLGVVEIRVPAMEEPAVGDRDGDAAVAARMAGQGDHEHVVARVRQRTDAVESEPFVPARLDRGQFATAESCAGR